MAVRNKSSYHCRADAYTASAMFLREISGSAEPKTTRGENYGLLNKRNVPTRQITILATRQVLFVFVISTCREENEPSVGVFVPLCTVSR